MLYTTQISITYQKIGGLFCPVYISGLSHSVYSRQKNPVQARKKIQLIKLDISNWRIAKIECKQIGGKSLSESFAYQEKSPEGCIFGDLSFVIPSRSTTLQKWWLQSLSPWVLFPIYFVMHYYNAVQAMLPKLLRIIIIILWSFVWPGIPNMGWLELIGTPSVGILHRSDCTWLCCLLCQ